MTEPMATTTRGGSASERARTRRPSEVGRDPADRIAELESRLARLERMPGLRERGRTMMGRVVPPEAAMHFRNAGREQLLGVRSIVDFWIERLDEAEARSRAGRSRERETIEIE